MTIEELDEYCFINSNQYFLGYENIEVKRPVLEGIIKRALMHYGNYKPFKYRKNNFEIITSDTKMKIKEIDGRQVQDILEIYFFNPIYGTNCEVSFHWDFDPRTKILYSQSQGTYLVDFMVRPILDDITYDEELFLQMVLGLYMMYVGEARKAFTLDGLPFGNDAEEIYSDGKEIYENALEELKEDNSSWWMAIK